jgi:HTH-type transcriptional regulator/antitoxin HigA
VLFAWYSLTQACLAYGYNDLKQMFAGVNDVPPRPTLFDVRGNRFGVVAAIHCNRQSLFVRHAFDACGVRPLDEEEPNLMNADRLPGAFPDVAQTWAMLRTQLPITPIRTDEDYQQMLRVANSLSDHLDGKSEDPLTDLYAIVTDLIGRWEAHSVSIPKAEPREVLRRLLETHGLKQKDLIGIASPTVVSDILAGRRAISKKVAKALASRFHMDVSAFL